MASVSWVLGLQICKNVIFVYILTYMKILFFFFLVLGIKFMTSHSPDRHLCHWPKSPAPLATNLKQWKITFLIGSEENKAINSFSIFPNCVYFLMLWSNTKYLYSSFFSLLNLTSQKKINPSGRAISNTSRIRIKKPFNFPSHSYICNLINTEKKIKAFLSGLRFKLVI